MEIMESTVFVAAVAIGWYALRLLTALGADSWLGASISCNNPHEYPKT
jgi:hypothetical protein